MTRIDRYRQNSTEGPLVTSADDDPRCPECGGAIGQTATYCMHCSADLTDERDAADSDDDGRWDESGGPAVSPESSGGGILDSLGIGGFGSGGESSPSVDPGPTVDSSPTGSDDATARSDQLLDPDGLVDNTLTVVVGIITGLFVGFVGIFVFLAATRSIWGLVFGLVVWLGSTAHLVRRRTVQGAISRGAYAVAIVFLLVPLVVLSPVMSVDGGLMDRLGGFVIFLIVMGIPAAIAAAIGFVVAQFVPESGGSRG